MPPLVEVNSGELRLWVDLKKKKLVIYVKSDVYVKEITYNKLINTFLVLNKCSYTKNLLLVEILREEIQDHKRMCF